MKSTASEPGLYFFNFCFLLDAVREKYSYISHQFHLRVAENLFNNFFMTWTHKESLSVVEFNRKYMKLTKFVRDLST